MKPQQTPSFMMRRGAQNQKRLLVRVVLAAGVLFIILSAAVMMFGGDEASDGKATSLNTPRSKITTFNNDNIGNTIKQPIFARLKKSTLDAQKQRSARIAEAIDGVNLNGHKGGDGDVAEAGAIGEEDNKAGEEKVAGQQRGGNLPPHPPTEDGSHAYSPQRLLSALEPLYPGTGIQAVLPDEGGDQSATTCFTRSYTDLVYENWPRRKNTKPSISPSGDLHIPPPDLSFFNTRSCHVLPRSFIALLQYWLEHVQLPVHLTGKSKIEPVVYERYIGGIADRLKGMYNAFFIAVVTRRPFVIRYNPRNSLPFEEGFVPLLSKYRLEGSSGCPLSTIDRGAPSTSQIYAECRGARAVSSNVQWIDDLVMREALTDTLRHLKKNYGGSSSNGGGFPEKSLFTYISEQKTKFKDDGLTDDLEPIRGRSSVVGSMGPSGSSWKAAEGGADATAEDKFWEQFKDEVGPMKGVRLTYLSACLIDSLFKPTSETLNILHTRASLLLLPPPPQQATRTSQHQVVNNAQEEDAHVGVLGEPDAVDEPLTKQCVQRKPLICLQVRYGKTRDYSDPQYVNDNGNDQLAEFMQQQLQAHESSLIEQGATDIHIAPNPAFPTVIPTDKLIEVSHRPPYFFQTLPNEHKYDAVAFGGGRSNSLKAPAPFCLFLTADVAEYQRKVNATLHKHFSHMFDPSCSMVDIKGSVHIAKSRGIQDMAMHTLGADFLFLRYCTKTIVTGDSGFGGLGLGLKARRDAIEDDFYGMHRDPSPAFFRRYYQHDGSKW